MRRRRVRAVLVWCLFALLSMGPLSGCQTAPSSKEEAKNEGASQVEEDEQQLFPIVDEEPLPGGDIRRLHNCAEYPFDEGAPGAWESIEGLELAKDAAARHRTTDRIVRVGERIDLDASIEYDTGPLAGEWVRLYVGDCERWKLKSVRQTDEDGYVSFRLEDRLPPGVYGVVFQVVGDETKTRGQLWVVSPKTEIVVFDMAGVVFEGDDRTADDEGPYLVDGAAERSKWHSDRGRLVIYVDNSQSGDTENRRPDLDSLRMMLRDEQFAVGPVVDVAIWDGGGDDDMLSARGNSGGEWGRAGASPDAGPPLPKSVKKVYGADSEILRLFERWGVEVDEKVLDEE